MRSGPAPAASVSIALLFLGLAACGGGHDAPTADVPPAAIYSVRGEVEDLPAPDRPQDWIALRHEAIPDFVGITGEPEPMPAMTMRFPVADEVDLSALSIGSRVAFELEVDWSAGDPARVLSIEPLPAAAELD